MDNSDPLLSAALLHSLADGILQAAGTPSAQAAVVAGSLVRSNLLGHDELGVRRLLTYIPQVRSGEIDPRARPKAEAIRPGAVIVHGQRAFGQLCAVHAVRELSVLAVEHGSGVAAIRDGNDVGRLGEYVGALADTGLVALAFGNAATTPVAWALPRATGSPPLIFDGAASPGAEIFAALVGGLLSGHGLPGMPGYDSDAGTVLVAVDIAAFLNPAVFREQAETFCESLSGVPGEPEELVRRRRAADGVPIPAPDLAGLRALLSDGTDR
ncbi:Ldh family oxidoreductase [Amycolatopsis magusensis]|uniref:Oxidoreductase n=1 Tax=Amycolatopsis magusensis TaxID=882444 RepID=A0ABS4PPB3_9PSEU|nr:Ldh family oxidoreductase [Amycolatopsis magusensis]MBP2181274.1 putative oxidoreductase [Amycolatopsis magusensis]MDI5976977.1 Ldh family oxidoreductase [Amycolatopsis magusensis]